MATQSLDLLIVDDFLDRPLLGSLLAHALAQEHATEPSDFYSEGKQLIDPAYRSSHICQGGLGCVETPFVEAVHARLDEIYRVLGLRPFAPVRSEVELVAHGDGAMFTKHVDTMTRENRPLRDGDRIVSVVFYFHREPKGFTGGEIAVYPMGQGSPQLIEPRNNRMIAFPSFTMHEVLPVSCPSGDFADSRFAINCWLHRARRPARGTDSAC